MRERNADGTRPVVLLVEDDPGDQELTRRALEEGGFQADLRIASDGEEAMDYLLRRHDFAAPATSPLPDLVLLDLNMPRLDGKQVLGQIRANQDLRRVPVVVLTTSAQSEDVRRSYELGCNSVITKPVSLDGFIDCVRNLGVYWFNLVALPPR